MEVPPKKLLSNSKEGWLVLFSGFCLHIIIGNIYLYGDFLIYLYSYIRQYDPMASLEILSLAFSIMYLISQVIMGYLECAISRFSLIKLNFFGILMIVTGYFICSFIKKAWEFVLCYSIFVGVGIGIIYMLPIVCGLRYFPNNQGRVIGLIHLGDVFGLGLYGLLSQYFLNINDTQPNYINDNVFHFNECIANEVPKFLKIQAALFMIFGIIGISYLQTPNNENQAYSNKKCENRENPIKNEIGNQLVLFSNLLVCEGLFYLIFHKNILLSVLYEDFETRWIGVLSVAMIWLMRVPFNLMFKNVKNPMILVIFLQFIAKTLIFMNIMKIGIFIEFIALGLVFSLFPKAFLHVYEFQRAKLFNIRQMRGFGLCAIMMSLLYFTDSYMLVFIVKDAAALGFFWWRISGIVFNVGKAATEYQNIEKESGDGNQQTIE